MHASPSRAEVIAFGGSGRSQSQIETSCTTGSSAAHGSNIEPVTTRRACGGSRAWSPLWCGRICPDSRDRERLEDRRGFLVSLVPSNETSGLAERTVSRRVTRPNARTVSGRRGSTENGRHVTRATVVPLAQKGPASRRSRLRHPTRRGGADEAIPSPHRMGRNDDGRRSSGSPAG